MEFPSPADSGPERYITSFAHRREVLRLQLTACPRLKQSSKVGCFRASLKDINEKVLQTSSYTGEDLEMVTSVVDVQRVEMLGGNDQYWRDTPRLRLWCIACLDT